MHEETTIFTQANHLKFIRYFTPYGKCEAWGNEACEKWQKRDYWLKCIYILLRNECLKKFSTKTQHYNKIISYSFIVLYARSYCYFASLSSLVWIVFLTIQLIYICTNVCSVMFMDSYFLLFLYIWYLWRTNVSLSS